MSNDAWDFELEACNRFYGDKFLSQMKPERKHYWDNVFLLDAVFWSRKSHDPQTQCGCVIIADDRTQISFGYNGFIRGIDNSKLPNTRPDKYPFMIHAEANAIYNAIRQGKSVMGATAYITGKPCVSCLQMMYQCGILEVVYTNVSNAKMTENCQAFEKVLDVLGDKMSLVFIDKSHLDISYFKEAIERITDEYSS